MDIRYFKAPSYLAERLGIQDARRIVSGDYVVLTEADMRMIDVTIDEKVKFFGCEVLTEQQSIDLLSINKTKEKEVEND